MYLSLDIITYLSNYLLNLKPKKLDIIRHQPTQNHKYYIHTHKNIQLSWEKRKRKS